jgi:predicted nuclease with TOPRIM domain
MANEPDNLVLIHLRELRATLAEHSARFDRIDDRFAQLAAYMSERFAQVDQRFAQMDQRFAQMDQRFAQMDQRFDGLRDLLAHTFALSTTNHLKSRQHDQLQQFNEGEHQRLTGRVDELERRLVKVEKKLES